jgi:UDP-glucose 4-epimerase
MGAEVTVLDDLSTGKIENIEKHLQKRSVKFVKGDVCNLTRKKI